MRNSSQHWDRNAQSLLKRAMDSLLNISLTENHHDNLYAEASVVIIYASSQRVCGDFETFEDFVLMRVG